MADTDGHAHGGAGSWMWFALAHTCLIILTGMMVYYAIFSGFTLYDDEGFMMMTVRHVLDGHRPYDDVVTAYGPVYYLYKWLLHGPLGLPLTHDVVRFNTIVLWLATALLSSGVVFAMTRSVALSVVTHVLVVVGLRALANEPGHPQEMGVLGYAALVLASIASRGGERKWGIALLGMLAGLLTMIKINLGVFALAAVWMALVSTLREPPIALALRVASTAGIVALPVVLTWGQLDRWSFFTLTAVASIVSVALMDPRLRPEHGGTDHSNRWAKGLATFTAAAVAGIALGILCALLKQASLSGLVNSLVVLPGRLTDVVAMRPPRRDWGTAVAGGAVFLSLLCAWRVPTRLRDAKVAAALAAAKLVFGLWTALMFWEARPQRPFQASGDSFLFYGMTPFLWLVLLPSRHGVSGRMGVFPRLVLVWAAVLQPLQAYPVPGSQFALGVFLHVVCAMVALGDVRDWARAAFPGLARPAVGRVGAIVMSAVVVGLVLGRVDTMRRRYDHLTPLAMPGAQHVRVPAQTAENLRSLVSFLRTNADTFLTYPGFNSLYFWTGKRPPTLDVLSHEVRLYSDQRQAAMVEALLAFKRPYVIRYHGPVRTDSVFTELVDRHFKLGASVGLHRLLIPRGSAVTIPQHWW